MFELYNHKKWAYWIVEFLLLPRRHLHKYLHHKHVLQRKESIVINENPKILVIAHVYYKDMLDEIFRHIAHIKSDVDLVVTTPHDQDAFHYKIHNTYPDATIIVTKNVGRDIWPFLSALRGIKVDQYDLLCKVHTKKSPHSKYGDIWKRSLLSSILGSSKRVSAIVDAFRQNQDVGLLCCNRYIGHQIDGNAYWYTRLSKQLNIRVHGLQFAAGSMFWVRPSLLIDLINCNTIQENIFKPHSEIDGQPEHAIERLIGSLVRSKGYHIAGVDVFSNYEYSKESTVQKRICYTWNGTFTPSDLSSPFYSDDTTVDTYCLTWHAHGNFLDAFKKPFVHLALLRNHFRSPAYLHENNRPLLVYNANSVNTLVIWIIWIIWTNACICLSWKIPKMVHINHSENIGSNIAVKPKSALLELHFKL